MQHPADHPIVSSRYFFPRPGTPDGEVRVSVNGIELSCARHDYGHKRTLIHFHGNGEIVSDYQPELPRIFSEMELNTFFAEYRGYGASTGSPKLAAMLDDIPAIVEASGAAPESIIFFGRSIGSIYAIEAACKYPQAAGLIIESGISNVLERILLRASPAELGVGEDQLRTAFSQSFDHAKKLSAFPNPILLLHAEQDHLVSVEHAYENARNATGSCTLKVLPKGDHNSIFAANAHTYLASVSEFIATL